MTLSANNFDILNKLELKISQLLFCVEVALGAVNEPFDIDTMHENYEQRSENTHEKHWFFSICEHRSTRQRDGRAHRAERYLVR